jgi:hypothetical protein
LRIFFLLFWSWSPGVGWGLNRLNDYLRFYVPLKNFSLIWRRIWKTIFTYVYIERKNFSRTSRPISIKLGMNHSWVKRILNCSNKGPGPFQRAYNHKIAKLWLGHWKKDFPWEPLSQNSSYLHESFLRYCTNYGPRWSSWGTQEGKLFLHLHIGRNFWKWNIFPISVKLGTNISYMCIQMKVEVLFKGGIITKLQK